MGMAPSPPSSKVTGKVSSWSANFTAMALAVPGIALYVYIVCIIVSKLVYPATFSPFTQSLAVSQDKGKK